MVDNLDGYFKSVKQNMEYGCYNFTKDGECSKCGGCCSSLLPLTESEIKRLKKIIKDRHLKPHEQPKVIVAQVDLTCPFLTDANLCSIYEERPYICKIFRCDRQPTVEEAMKAGDLIPINVRDLFD